MGHSRISPRLRSRVGSFLNNAGAADRGLAHDVPLGLADGPIGERLHELEGALLKHLDVLIAQADELDDAEYTTQAQGEVIATLIVLRALWHRLPELHGMPEHEPAP